MGGRCSLRARFHASQLWTRRVHLGSRRMHLEIYSALHGCDKPPRYWGHPWLSPTPRPHTPKQCVEFAPRTDGHSGRCKRASAKMGSTYPHITDLGRTAGEDKLNLGLHFACIRMLRLF